MRLTRTTFQPFHAGLFLVLAIAALMRLAGIGTFSFSMDEAATAAFITLPWPELLHGVGKLEPNPPAYYAFEKVWTELVGCSDFLMRLPSSVFGLAGIVAVVAFTWRCFGRGAAGVSALLLTFQLHHLEHSREARVYALLFLCVALVCLAMRRLTSAEEAPAWKACLLLALLGGIAMQLHNTGLIAVACVYVYGFVVAVGGGALVAPRLRMLALAGASSLVMATPVLLNMSAVATSGDSNAAWIPAADLSFASIMVTSVFSIPLLTIFALPSVLVPAAFCLGLLTFAAVLVSGVMRARASGPEAVHAAGLVAGIGAAVIGMYAASQIVPVLIERTLMFALVLFVPLAAAAVASLPRWPGAAVVAVLIGFQAPGLSTIFTTDRLGQGWSELAVELRRDAALGHWPVVVMGGFETTALERYIPEGDPARPRLTILPRPGPRLVERMARLTTAAPVLHTDAATGEFCGALGGRDKVVLVLRSVVEQVDVQRLLRATGAVEDGMRKSGALVSQYWRHVCSAAT